MPKTIRNEFDKNLTFIKLLEAYNRVKRGKTNRKEVLEFSIDLETNLVNILNSLKNNTYKIDKYKEFKIYVPKERLIKSLPFKDRIVQDWYINEFIKPYIIPRFIKDSYACIDNRGTHRCVEVIQKYMRKMNNKYGNYYVLKCDIMKFFYNIDKDILYKIMSKYITDKKLLNLTYIFIYDTSDEISIPIGNYTSQYFSNIYLHELDKYVKEKLKIKYYTRYCDDFVILLPTKEECKNVRNKIEVFLETSLKLKLNSKSRYYPNKMGVNFCGYRIYETHKLIRKRSKDKIRKNIKIWNCLYSINKLDKHKMLLVWNSFKAHSSHSNSYNLRLKLFNTIIYNDNIDI